MNKLLTITISIIFSLTLVSAITIYSGESYELQLDKPYDYWGVVGNSTEVNITLTQDSNNLVTITPNKYSQEDSYEIIFFDSEKETITVYQSSGGGGGGTVTRWVTEYVDNDVTSYIDREVIKYVDKNVTEDTEGEVVEKIVTKTSWWSWMTIFLLVLIIFYIVVRRSI